MDKPANSCTAIQVYLMKKFETKAIRTQSERTQNKEHAVPVYLTSSFVFEDAEDMRAVFAEEKEAHAYSRYSNPNLKELVEIMCALEGTETGITAASGMSGIFTTFATFLNAGDHILSCASIFGSTHSLLVKYFPKWNISHTFFDAQASTASLEKLVQPNTKMLFVETPTNPAVDIIDLAALEKFAKAHNLLFVVDNCFATPYLQKPIQYGADLVLHSATKYTDGQGRVLGGLILGREELIREAYLFARVAGPAMSPFNAWVLSKSLETLAVRMERHCANALYIAEQLSNHKAIDLVKYPFLPSHPQHEIAKKQMRLGGGIVTFSLKEGLAKGRSFLNNLKMLSLSPNLGDTRTIATHPASTTHAKLSEEERLQVGITEGMVRISVGLEHQEDILEDILQAIEA